MDLTSQNVNAIIVDCLYRSEELQGLKDGAAPEGAILVPGITHDFGFHPERLQAHKDEVLSFIEQLPVNFLREPGGGWSFLNLCMTKDDEQWGEHLDCEALYVLAAGLKLAGFCLPKKMWEILPGGMPYVWFSKEPVVEKPVEKKES
jgi:hypothetical protein